MVLQNHKAHKVHKDFIIVFLCVLCDLCGNAEGGVCSDSTISTTFTTLEVYLWNKRKSALV
jgi:hypothetical protein